MTIFTAGMAQIDITPPVGVDMAGYALRTAAGVHRPLMAVAAVFDDRAGHRSAVCAVDVCGLPAWLVAAVRRRLAEDTAAPEHVMLAATHTHSGPIVGGANPLNQEWTRTLEDRLVQVIQTADRQRREARIGAAAGRVDGIGGNRRDPAHGPVDRSVTVLRLDEAQSGAPIGTIVSHACHATTLDLHNRLLSPDYPGEVRAFLAARLAGAPPVLFLNGACGDVNPGGYSAEASALGKPIPNRTLERAAEIGAAIGTEALRLLRDLPTRTAGRVFANRQPLTLETLPTAPPAEAEAALLRAEAALRDAVQAGAPPDALDHLTLETIYLRAAAHRAKARAATPGGAVETEVQVVAVDEVILLGLPGEAFTEIGLQLKAASPFRWTLVVGYANDAAGYFPTRAAMAAGGYEVRVSPFGPEAVQRLIDGGIDLCRTAANALRTDPA